MKQHKFRYSPICLTTLCITLCWFA